MSRKMITELETSYIKDADSHLTGYARTLGFLEGQLEVMLIGYECGRDPKECIDSLIDNISEQINQNKSG